MSELLLRMSTLGKSSSQRASRPPHQKETESCCSLWPLQMSQTKIDLWQKGYEKDSPHALCFVPVPTRCVPSLWLPGGGPERRSHSHSNTHRHAGHFAERESHHLHDAGEPLL